VGSRRTLVNALVVFVAFSAYTLLMMFYSISGGTDEQF
jgi:hypothetical protein